MDQALSHTLFLFFSTLFSQVKLIGWGLIFMAGIYHCYATDSIVTVLGLEDLRGLPFTCAIVAFF